ncbi:amino acid ABC transporter permease [Nesterenkonia flava]|uniref:Amino acid ABC transporter permease n=1 Tax=Nesterenkonia flava TaxID=469799 RepID=A0ABU1FR10_9MICC|nr:amino acid ABC transporter permease [Nesterenkonia flava]MDR5711085.1 amino acid ABC transporter permease [Nesterenkonia flava]
MEGLLSLIEDYPVFESFWMNIRLAVLSCVLAFIIGAVLALFRISPVPSLQWIGAAYVNVVRNTPLTVIMVMGVLVVWGQLHINFSEDFGRNFFLFAVAGLTLYHAPFFCEAIRSGVNTVPVGQAEAARSIGLSFLPAARLVIFPQALRGAITPIGNTVISLTKNTTVAAAASVTEISAVMRSMMEFNPNLMIYIFLTVALGFCIIVIPIGLLTTYLSNKLAVAR